MLCDKMFYPATTKNAEERESHKYICSSEKKTLNSLVASRTISKARSKHDHYN